MAKSFKNLREKSPEPVYNIVDQTGHKRSIFFGDADGTVEQVTAMSKLYGINDMPSIKDSVFSNGRVKFDKNANKKV